MRNIMLHTFSLVAIGATSVAAQGGAIRVTPPTGAAMSRGSLGADSGIIRRFLDSTTVTTSYSANRPRIGVSVSLASGNNDAVGALIEAVTPKGPADKAGVKAGDIIMKVNEVTIANPATVGTAGGESIVGTRLIETLAGLKPGVPATLQLKRGKETLSLKVTPELDDSQVMTMIYSTKPGMLDRAHAESISIFMKMLPGIAAMRDGQMITEDKSFIRSAPNAKVLEEYIKALPTVSVGGMTRFADTNRRTIALAAPAGAGAGGMTFRMSFDALSRLELAPINADLGSYFGATEGVLVISIAPPFTVTSRTILAGPASSGAVTAPPSSAAATDKDASTPGNTEILNLKPGDVITAVDGRKVATPSDLMRYLRSYQRNDDVKLTVLRQKKSTTINTKMPTQ